jgi:hypothetical protein
MADTWQVTGQRKVTQLNPMGTAFEQVWEVHYKVNGGASRGLCGSIEVPVASYNADYVRDAIAAEVAAADAVASL